MASDPARRPTISGISQIVQRVGDPREAAEPIALMERAIREAAEDAGAPNLIEHLDGIYVPQGLWRYGDPGRLLAERLGSPNARTVVGAVSGHIVQILLNRACREIAAGKADVIAIVGGESENSKRAIQRAGHELHWNDEIPGEPDGRAGEMKYVRHDGEIAAGIVSAVAMFSICETSLRHSLGETPAAHRTRIAELMHEMSKVGASNPYAWIQREVPADEIRNPGQGNRMVNYPYTKLMTSNISVDQSGALILCSTEAADRFGIPKAKRVHLRASTEMSKTTLLSARNQLHRHAGQELAAQRVLELGGKRAADLDHVDLYSCFPFAIQSGATALGITTDPVPSLTGGMTFFGGPFGNYVIHSKATMVERLRADPGSVGAIGSVGGNYAHFSYGLYSTEPAEPIEPAIVDVSDEFAAMKDEHREVLDNYEGPATVESYSVVVNHDGPAQITIAGMTESGHRVWARSHDADLLAAALDDEELCDRPMKIADGIAELG
jgi:acetyl-CoA C-acetyltransferase